MLSNNVIDVAIANYKAVGYIYRVLGMEIEGPS